MWSLPAYCLGKQVSMLFWPDSSHGHWSNKTRVIHPAGTFSRTLHWTQDVASSRKYAQTIFPCHSRLHLRKGHRDELAFIYIDVSWYRREVKEGRDSLIYTSGLPDQTQPLDMHEIPEKEGILVSYIRQMLWATPPPPPPPDKWTKDCVNKEYIV